MRKSTPAMTRRLAKVCLRQCQEKSRILAVRTAVRTNDVGRTRVSPQHYGSLARCHPRAFAVPGARKVQHC